MTPRPRERFTLLLEDVAANGDAPVAIRLRAVLKRLLRAFGFRCVSIAKGEAARNTTTGDDDQHEETAGSH